MVVEEETQLGIQHLGDGITAASGLLLIATHGHLRGAWAVGGVQESLDGICWFVKLNFVTEGTHYGGFTSPWANCLVLCCSFCVMGVLFLNSNLGLDLREVLNFSDIYGGPKAAKHRHVEG